MGLISNHRLYNRQRIQGKTSNNNIIRGMIITKNNQQFVLMEGKQVYPVSRLKEYMLEGRILETEISAAVDNFLQPNKFEYMKMRDDPKFTNIIDAVQTQIEGVIPEAKANKDEVNNTIKAKIELNAQSEEGKSKGDPKAEEAAKQLTDAFASTDKVDETTIQLKLDCYLKEKRERIGKKLKEDYGDQDSIEYENADEEGHGFAPEAYKLAKEKAKELLDLGAEIAEVVEEIYSTNEVDEEEAADCVYSAGNDSDDENDSPPEDPYELDTSDFDEKADDLLDSSIDEFENEAEIYSDEKLWEYVCRSFNYNGSKLLEQNKRSVPDAIIQLSETIKQKHLIEQMILKSKDKKFTSEQNADFYLRHFPEATSKDIKNFEALLI